MRTLEVFAGSNWLMALCLALTILGTGLLTFLWILQHQVKRRVLIWIIEPLNLKEKIKWKVNFKYSARAHPSLLSSLEGVKSLLYKFIHWHAERLMKSGMPSGVVKQRARKWCFLLISGSMFLLFKDLKHPEKALLFFSVLYFYFWRVTEVRMKTRQYIFVTGVYKIYRHMALQISSGMTCAEAIKYLHESVEEPFLKEAMYRFSSCYFKTMDLDLSLNELTESIEGDEVQVLATVLRQGLQTGDSYEMIIKQEQLMVKRYYAALSSESDRIRTKGVLIAIGLCILIFILLAAPMIYEMGRATQSIFSGQ